MDFAQQQRSPSRHLVGISMVVAMHIVIVYALLTGLGKNVIEIAKQPFVTKIIEDIKKPPPPEPPPQTNIKPPPPPPFVPMPDLVIANLVATGPTITAAPAKTPPPQTSLQPVPPTMTAAVIDPKHACSMPEYPPLSVKRDEEGSTTLMMLVDVDGRVRESKVQQGSGHERMDRAAKDALTLCHFKPATIDGVPHATWQPFRYVWRLN